MKEKADRKHHVPASAGVRMPGTAVEVAIAVADCAAPLGRREVEVVTDLMSSDLNRNDMVGRAWVTVKVPSPRIYCY